MKNMTAIPIIASLLIVVLAAGCSNPADNKPVAEVGEEIQKPLEAPASVEAKQYVVADSSEVRWIGSKVTGSHAGGFKSVTGTASVVAENSLASSISITIDTTSIWADNDKLAGHLKSADFFDVATYPEAVFVSTTIAPASEGYSVTGNFTLHGVTKSITFPAHITVTDDTLSAQAEFVINRMDFGIKYAGKTDDLIREEVVITFDITAALQS